MTNAVAPQPLSRRSAALHIALGVLALAALWLPNVVPQLAPYAPLLKGICTALGITSVAAARAYFPPRVLAILDSFSPTPPATPVEVAK